jgi:capsule polysaccharide export protein KpsE/RkpR
MLEQNYGANDPQVRNSKELVRQLREQYERAQTQPGFAGNFALTDAAGVGASYLRIYADFEAHTKLKAFLLPSLEQAKLDMNKTAPSLLVVDTPVVPEKRDRPKRVFIAVGAGLGVGIFTLLVLLLMRGWKTMMGKPTEQS